MCLQFFLNSKKPLSTIPPLPCTYIVCSSPTWGGSYGFRKKTGWLQSTFFFRATSTIDRGARFAMRRARLDRAVSKTSYARHGLPVGNGRVAVAWRQTIFTYRHGVIVSNGRYFDDTCLMWFSSTGTLNKQSIITIWHIFSTSNRRYPMEHRPKSWYL